MRYGLLLTAAFEIGVRLTQGMIGPFLVDAGLDLSTLGILNGVGGTIAGLVGTFLGGVIVRWCGPQRAVLLAAALQATVLILLALAVVAGTKSYPVLIAITILQTASMATGFVSLYSLLMELASLRQAGVDFTLFQCADAAIAGVAGLAAAWWLQRIGWRTIIVERSDSLRDSGYMIGLSGPGYDTVTRMGLLPLLQSASYEINENVYRDRRGKEILRLRYRDFLRGLPYLAIRRSNLVSVMRDAISPDTEIRLDTTVTTFTETTDSVAVSLSDGTTIEADLLIGADGVRSACRQMLFGSDNCLVPLGYRFAVYDIDVSFPIEADFYLIRS